MHIFTKTYILLLAHNKKKTKTTNKNILRCQKNLFNTAHNMFLWISGILSFSVMNFRKKIFQLILPRRLWCSTNRRRQSKEEEERKRSKCMFMVMLLFSLLFHKHYLTYVLHDRNVVLMQRCCAPQIQKVLGSYHL